ncbi:hypothetical protein EYM_04885 [Ignicoccus islandicus DSM 13165]|uniref:Beta-ribofuranosylaminobenzene 5'-phosphate synthase n=1 Tax=Ignicoccus islandicus DSM 13165 TaxID=940295 RepID=A0A0U2M9R6_9CREN|nr:beta-ribofuranosylaminobenzene 5'-phosphate synthase family protein [Ignicoccus islandicus]ALU11805.1 hypothetical protein EYM_04885 [Ignicoccus islandicus DSM 13165]
MIAISSPSRIHVSLLDLTGNLGYLDGGIGFAIKLPRTVVVGRPSEDFKVIGPRANEVYERLKGLNLKGELEIRSTPPAHMGFGSTTQLLLSSAKALCSLNGINCSSRELAILTGRGGTSGIGVAVFEEGGFVADFGHSIEVKEKPSPSGASRASPPPYLRLELPEEWIAVIAYPDKRKGIYDEVREVTEFEERTPIREEESSKAIRIAYMLIMGGVVERNLERFSKGINSIQEVGFKRIEWELQPSEVKEACTEMRRVFGNCGLSSMGQAIYSVTRRENVRKKVSEIELNGFNLLVTPFDNSGASVKSLSEA